MSTPDINAQVNATSITPSQESQATATDAIRKSREGGVLKKLEDEKTKLEDDIKKIESSLPKPISEEICEKFDFNNPLDDWLTSFPMDLDSFWRSIGVSMANVKDVNDLINQAGLVKISGSNVTLGSSKSLSPKDMRGRICCFIYYYFRMLNSAVECFKLINKNGDQKSRIWRISDMPWHMMLLHIFLKKIKCM